MASNRAYQAFFRHRKGPPFPFSAHRRSYGFGFGRKRPHHSLDIAGQRFEVDGQLHAPASAHAQRARLDGSEIEDLVTEGLQTSQAIALDLGEGRMYWTDYGTDKIQRANPDGSQVEDLAGHSACPRAADPR